MAGNFLDSLTMADLPGEQLEIAEIVGLDAYKKLVRHFGGSDIRILQEDTLVKEIRDNQIRKEYNGHNDTELCRKYGLSDRTIRAILAGLRQIDGQQSFFP